MSSLLYNQDGSLKLDLTGGGGGSGTVTNVASGAGLTGGPITTTGTLSVTNQETDGFTGQSGYSAGDVLYASAINTLARLPVGTNSHVLTLVAGLPAWAAPATSGTVTSVGSGTGLTGGPITSTGTLSVTNNETDGFTGQTTYTTGDMLYASAANTLAKLAAGTNGYILTMVGGIPAWAANSGGSSAPGRYVSSRHSSVAEGATTYEMQDNDDGTTSFSAPLYSFNPENATTVTPWVKIYADRGDSFVTTTGALSATTATLASSSSSAGTIDLAIGYNDPFAGGSYTQLCTATINWNDATLESVNNVTVTWSPSSATLPAGNIVISKVVNNLTMTGAGTIDIVIVTTIN